MAPIFVVATLRASIAFRKEIPMTEGWGGDLPYRATEADEAPAQERSIAEVADDIEERAIKECRSLHYSIKDAASILAAFAIVDRLRGPIGG
jgi:hypothetical protein